VTSKKNTAEKKFSLVPGIGLRDNAKLREAIEKVLARGNLSERAKENLMRLSASIASDTEVTKYMESSKTKSNITLRIKYIGKRNVTNFMLYEKLPKAFASSSDNATVSVSGATYGVVQKDPEYIFTFPQMAKDQTSVITFSVGNEVNTTVLDQTVTEVYGEVYEGLTGEQVCGPGEKKCSGSDLAECSADQKSWNTVKACTFGCENAECNPPPSGQPGAWEIDWSNMGGFLMTFGIPLVAIVIVIILAAVVLRRRKKKPSLPRPVPSEVKVVPEKDSS
jgi:hypothetical protein